MRWLSLAAGAALIAAAFIAATRIADTREGLVAEVVTLLGGGAGLVLLLYGLVARPGLAQPPARGGSPRPGPQAPASTRELLLGLGGVVLALFLLGGLAYSGGALWASLGFLLMLPMLVGSVYLLVRFARARRS